MKGPIPGRKWGIAVLAAASMAGCDQGLPGSGSSTQGGDASAGDQAAPPGWTDGGAVTEPVAPPPSRAPADSYIVTVREGVDPAAVAQRHRVAARFVYRHALNGFAATLPAGLARVVADDPDVTRVDPDGVAQIFGETVPTGIARSQATQTCRVPGDGRIAILDTGIDLGHPDLRVVANMSFVGTANGDDGHGHGTHVAGIAAALKGNGVGVVGVAPGAELIAVKVLSDSGSGLYSEVIAGVNWVAANAAKEKIKVANMSLGGPAYSPMDSAVRSAIAAGVVFTIAAGNSNQNASRYSPARVAEAITVSALADFDGLPGGRMGNVFGQYDDSIASWSNYGSVIDVAAPGVSIYSTYKGGGFATMSGTSMAAPHVAGGALLYRAAHSGATATDVQNALKNYYAGPENAATALAVKKALASGDVNWPSLDCVGKPADEGGYRRKKGTEPLVWFRNL